MLMINDEISIKELLAAGKTRREIARVIGVSRASVDTIAQMCELVESIPADKRERARGMLFSDVPIGAIEIETKLPRDLIAAIRRFYFVQRRCLKSNKPMPCPTCGSMMFSESSKVYSLPPGTGIPKRTLSKEDSAALYSIVTDLLELDGLRIVPNPLFYQLARRAESTLENINGKKANAAG